VTGVSAFAASAEAVTLGRIFLTPNAAGKSIIGWGFGQASLAVLRAGTQSLTRDAVRQMDRRGLTLELVRQIQQKYADALLLEAKHGGNAILQARYDLMTKIIDLWPR
jgi:Domain of unknown function (DUF4951)